MRTPIVRSITLASGATHVERCAGRIFVCISATGTFDVQPYNGVPFPMVTGRGFGDVQAVDFSQLVFINTSGASNTIIFYVGDTPFRVVEPQTVALDAATVAALAAAIAAGGTERTATGPVEISTSATYSALKYLEVHNTGATDIDVNGEPVAAGEYVVFPMLPGGDTYADITVDATGGTAKVIRIA